MTRSAARAVSTADNTRRVKLEKQLHYLDIADVVIDTRNPRKHNREQVRAIARSIEAFGFNAPILVDKNTKIIAGHGRYQAALLSGLTRVPVIRLEHLSDAQARAYMLADNKLTDRSSWDDQLLALNLKELSDLALDFEIESTGFEMPEIDFHIQSLNDPEVADRADEYAAAAGKAVSRVGDLWLLGEHRLLCGNALDGDVHRGLLDGAKAAAVFTDPPYNVPIDGHVCGNGKVKHREFVMASGEMSEQEFAAFLRAAFDLLGEHTAKGGVIYVCMDWRHVGEITVAAKDARLEHLNMCVWVKRNGGMGNLYRSRHEIIFVFRNGSEPHLNNVQLGRFGRNRTNVWNYPGANSFPTKGRQTGLEWHPTSKPVAMVADAILDVTKRGDVVLDPFLGGGSTILAAERTGRRCYGIEIDPLYIDTAISRWEATTGLKARHETGPSFAELQAARSALP